MSSINNINKINQELKNRFISPLLAGFDYENEMTKRELYFHCKNRIKRALKGDAPATRQMYTCSKCGDSLYTDQVLDLKNAYAATCTQCYKFEYHIKRMIDELFKDVEGSDEEQQKKQGERSACLHLASELYALHKRKQQNRRSRLNKLYIDIPANKSLRGELHKELLNRYSVVY